MKGSQKIGDSTILTSFLIAEELSAINGSHCAHDVHSDELKQKYHSEDIYGWALPHLGAKILLRHYPLPIKLLQKNAL